MSAPHDGAVFVLPTTPTGQLGPVAGWISTSGWAAAAARELGHAWIVTRDGIRTADEVRAAAARPTTAAPGPPRRRARRAVPVVLKTLAKDVREARRAARFVVASDGPWNDLAGELAFVWQRHELFHRAGLRLAATLGVPSVLFVPALHVWQAERWSVGRPGWGGWLERTAEAPALRAATLVACGTDLVAEQVLRLGVPDGRVIVTPTGVDLAHFEAADRTAARRSLGIEDDFVVGWAGSFRAFHRIEQLIDAAALAGPVTLLLVGDGPERAAIERRASAAGVRARFTGMVPHHELPSMLAAMDVGVVLASPDVPFHYSPLKAAEYLAAGLPVVAPAVAQLAERLDDGGNADLYRVGDVAALAATLRALGDHPERRRSMAEAARRSAPAWSWDHQVRRVRAALAGSLS